MRMILVFLLFFSVRIASAQGVLPLTTEQATYHVTDMMDKKNSRMETWQVIYSSRVRPSGRVFRGPYTVIKESFEKKNTQSVRSDGIWRDETRTDGLDTYLVERYETHPSLFSSEGSGFGYFEIRNTATDEVVTNWPVFFKVRELFGVYHFILHGYMPDGIRLVIERDYRKGEYFSPLQERQSIVFGEEILIHFIFSRMK